MILHPTREERPTLWQLRTRWQMIHSLGSVAFLSIFSTSCCSFDVSEACAESNNPPKGNFALNCSDIRGIRGLVARRGSGLTKLALGALFTYRNGLDETSSEISLRSLIPRDNLVCFPKVGGGWDCCGPEWEGEIGAGRK